MVSSCVQLVGAELIMIPAMLTTMAAFRTNPSHAVLPAPHKQAVSFEEGDKL